ncbi:uncharacterized protein TNCV_3857071 [Trichonephila clavipes]|nr:uncharacterized protein TNCV_3857071 [Trichonephila clavipes]
MRSGLYGSYKLAGNSRSSDKQPCLIKALKQSLLIHGLLGLHATGVFSEAIKCLQCEATGLKLSCEENCSGGAVELYIIYDFCIYSYKFCSSKKCKAEIWKPNTYEINTRLVYAIRCIGKGSEAARMFCGIMNLPPPPTKFSKYNKMLLGATKDVCDATMKDAVEEAVQENQNIRDIPVAVDGT